MMNEIAQLRPEGIDAAVEFARSIGCELKTKAIDPNISLIAVHDQAIIAALLGVRNPGGGCDLHVCLSKLDEPQQLTAELIDKALMKVHGVGIRRCQLSHHGPDVPAADWPGAKWQAMDSNDDTPPPAAEAA